MTEKCERVRAVLENVVGENFVWRGKIGRGPFRWVGKTGKKGARKTLGWVVNGQVYKGGSHPEMSRQEICVWTQQ